MSDTSTRVTVHQIPAPGEQPQTVDPGSTPSVLWPSAVVFALGFALYFASLVFTNSAAGVAGAICLIVLGIVIYVASALHQQVDTIDVGWHADPALSPDIESLIEAQTQLPVVDAQPPTVATPARVPIHQ